MVGITSENYARTVDDIDLDILRWMYPGGVMSMWGTDPRISAAEIASHVGLDRTAVWARIGRWKRDGFWDGFEVTLNYTIFGVGLLHAEILVADAADGWSVVDQLETIDGVVSAALAFGDAATARDVEVVAVMMIADDPKQTARRVELLRSISPQLGLVGPFRREPPSCPRALTALDWRLISAIVAHPNLRPCRIAHLLRVSLKTFGHHWAGLLDDHALFYVPRVDWSQLGCVPLNVYCIHSTEVPAVRHALAVRFPHSIPISLDGVEGGAPEHDPARRFAVIVPAHSPNDLQTLVRDLSKVPGVRTVRPELWGPQRQFTEWARQRIADRLAHSAADKSWFEPDHHGLPGRGHPRHGPPPELGLV